MDMPAAEAQREGAALLTARVRDAALRPPLQVDGSADLVAVCRALAAQGRTEALVRDGDRLGIFTTTDLRDALLREVPPLALAVRELASFDLVTVQAADGLFEALWRMVGREVHRLVVLDGDAVLGVLGALELLGLTAGHSQLIALQIDEAGSAAALRPAAARIDGMIALLHESGVRIERIAHLVGALNARLMRRLWTLLAPPGWIADSCLLVMGSEGRGEQILKTDQDNALLLRDGCDFSGIERIAADFGAALAGLGYPPCPGGIMLANPLWRQPLAAFRETMRGWVRGPGGGPTPDGAMQLAIFFDAVAVAGDPALLQEARAWLDRLVGDQAAFLAHFAAAADQFQEPGSWLTRLTARRDETPLDLKKLGTFPIVHGVRALALQYGVREPGTAARLQALAAAGHLDAAQARDLRDALHLLMSVRLTHQLRQRAAGQAAGNEVRPSALSTLEREALRDALAIVKGFRRFLRQHFRLDAL